MESSIADCQDQDGVAGEDVNQVDLSVDRSDACKQGYRFCREKVSQEGSVQGATCGS